MAAGLYNFIVTEMGGLCLFCYGKEPDPQGSADSTELSRWTRYGTDCVSVQWTGPTRGLCDCLGGQTHFKSIILPSGLSAKRLIHSEWI